jgi:hypothetical protein
MRRAVALGVVLLMLLAVVPTISAATSNTIKGVVGTKPILTDSTTWAGYVVAAAEYSVTSVQAEWVQPSFHGSCAALYNASSVAFWVGVDGWGSNTVEQIGTEIDCTSVLWIQDVSIYAWYEFYPESSVTISMTIHPGDEVIAEAAYLATATPTFALSIVDVTTGHSFAVFKTGFVAERTSAEWIVESPELCHIYGCSTAPLPDFGTIHFSLAYATISGRSDSISGFPVGDTALRVNSVTTKYVVKALTSGLSDSGTKFSVTWKTYGP